MNLTEIAAKVVNKAREKKQTLAIAESVTGGMIASALTDIPGASEVLLCGVVAYSENAKIHALGVDIAEIRKTHGYSQKTAQQMAERVRTRNAASIGISTTGCAGPDAAGDFPVGKVVFGLSQRDKETQIFEEHFNGDRKSIREQATQFALEKLLAALQ